MDFAGPFPPSGEGKWDKVIVIVDKLTKRAHFVPSKATDTAVHTATRFFDNVVKLHGMPKTIVSDRDAKFTSAFWTTLASRYGTQLAMSSSYHSQTDGQSERMVRTPKDMLRSAVSHQQTDWTRHFAPLEFAYNNAWHPSTKMTPFELDLGYHPRTPYSVMLQDTPDVASVADFTQHIETLQNLATAHLEKARQVQAMSVNACRPKPTAFQVGDHVLLSTRYTRPTFMRQSGNKKLRPKFIGPFEIIRRVGQTSYELDLPAGMKVHSVINIEYLREYHRSAERFGSRDTHRRLNTDGLIGEPEVQEIRGHRLSRGITQLLVHYTDTADIDDAWVNSNAVKNRSLADTYMQKVQDGGPSRSARGDWPNARAMKRISELRDKERIDNENQARILAALRSQLIAQHKNASF